MYDADEDDVDNFEWGDSFYDKDFTDVEDEM